MRGTKKGAPRAQKPFTRKEGLEAQAEGSRIELFLILRGKVTISINYRGLFSGVIIKLLVGRFFLQADGVLGDDF